MTDILINNHRLKFFDGDFVLTSGIEMLKQQIVVALHIFYGGDFALDPEAGIDYVGGFKDTGFLEDDLKRQILSIEGVKYVTNLTISFDRRTLAIDVLASISTEYGMLNIDEKIKIRT